MPTVFNRSDRRHRTHVGPVDESPPVVATPQCSPKGNIVRTLGRTLLGRWRRSVVTAAVIGALFVPLPLGVRCDCELQPEVRRSVAAPFAAIWRKSFVRPGDVVAVGQPLGLLDAAELQRELAAATAERDRAAKSADVNGAAGRTAAAQIDRLEVRRIDERRALLAERLANVEVKSPIAGVVLSGECDRAEGAPLRQGAVLYEIGPLERMTVEASVPEGDLDRVRAGATTSVVLDARPYEKRAAAVTRIYPRAEIRDGANVFVAEIALDNRDGLLRPGMKGRVQVATEPRSAARWIADRYWPTLGRIVW
jgi:multidrug efflux pump subunit AcrA (membrane-fusion protein)